MAQLKAQLAHRPLQDLTHPLAADARTLGQIGIAPAATVAIKPILEQDVAALLLAKVLHRRLNHRPAQLQVQC